MGTVKQPVGRTGDTSASAISRALQGLGHVKFHQFERDHGGYHCSAWGKDTKGATLVKVEYRRPGRGIKGTPSEKTLNEIRRERLIEMTQGLRETGYYVSWGWDDNGDPDTTFIVASVNPAREEAVQAPSSAPETPAQEPVPTVPSPDPKEALWSFLISIPEIEETVLEIHRAHNAGKDDAARRMEHTLYQKVLLAIVGGRPTDPKDLAAAALATQHLSFAR